MALKPVLISFVVKRFSLLPQAVKHNSSVSPEHHAEHVVLILASGTALAATTVLAKELV